ncbi:MAG: hypothetical protein LBQ89_01615 [Treponema sp.]|nr:hypothetical protein [Treponema sp.]
MAGGAFAQQGSWDISGSASVETKIDFDGDPLVAEGVSQGDHTNGGVDITYKLNGLTASIGFHAFGGISGSAEYEGDNYKFKVGGNLLEVDPAALNSSDVVAIGTVSPGDLWGYYKLVGGIVHLEAAWNGRGDSWWESDNTAPDLIGGFDFGWGKLDGIDGVLVNIEIANLQAGVLAPHFFHTAASHDPDPAKILSGILNKVVVGFKIDMNPINFAAQFKAEDYGIYVGAEAKFAMLTFGISFIGTFLNETNAAAGLKIQYDADPISAWIKVAMGLAGNPLETSFIINPGFNYKVIPDYFWFGINSKFGIGNDAIDWYLNPKMGWNFRGSGATDDPGTGFIIQYEVGKGNGAVGWSDVNQFSARFKWNFF